MKLKKLNSHPRDELIEFDEKPHKYYVKDFEDDFISVTTFIHNFFPKFNADQIIDKMMSSRNWPKSKYFGLSKEEIKQEWEDNKNLAAHDGTIMHKDIELYLNDIEVINNSKEFQFFLDFIKDHNYLIPYRTEWEVFDEDLYLAGSIDMCFTKKGSDEIIIYDWKRSKDIKEDNLYESGFYPISHLPNANYWHYSLQLNIYKRILEKKYNKKVSEMYLLWLHPNNDSYKRIEVVDLSKEVEDLLNIRKEEVSLIKSKN